MLIGIVQDLERGGIADVQVKLSHEGTHWHPGRLYRFSEDVTMTVEVTPEGYRYLTTDEVARKSGLTRIVPSTLTDAPLAADAANQSADEDLRLLEGDPCPDWHNDPDLPTDSSDLSIESTIPF